MSDVDAVVLDLGNVLVFHDDAILIQRLAQLGGKTPEVVRAGLSEIWEPCNRGRLAGESLRQAVGAAAGVELAEDHFRETWSCHFRFHEEVLPVVESLIGRVKLLL